jgi:hypothetical protein
MGDVKEFKEVVTHPYRNLPSIETEIYLFLSAGGSIIKKLTTRDLNRKLSGLERNHA